MQDGLPEVPLATPWYARVCPFRHEATVRGPPGEAVFPLLLLAENVRHYVATVPHDYGHLRGKTGYPSAVVLRTSTCDRVLSRRHSNRVLPIGADGRGKPPASRRNESVSPTGREDAAAE